MWGSEDQAVRRRARAWWVSTCGVGLIGALLAAQRWSVSVVAVGVVLDTVVVSLLWALVVALALPGDSRGPVRTAPIVPRALWLVGCGLAVGAFASLSVAPTVVGVAFFLALSPVSLRRIDRHRKQPGPPRSVPTGART